MKLTVHSIDKQSSKKKKTHKKMAREMNSHAMGDRESTHWVELVCERDRGSQVEVQVIPDSSLLVGGRSCG